MPEEGVRSTYSQCPIQLLLYDEQGLLTSASAFFYYFCDQTFLITNWHVLTGKDVFSKKYLSEGFRAPSRLVAKLARWLPGKNVSFGIMPTEVPLYSGSQPIWFEHPEFGDKCDVVAIPWLRAAAIPDFMHNNANKISDTKIPGTIYLTYCCAAIPCSRHFPHVRICNFATHQNHCKLTST